MKSSLLCIVAIQQAVAGSTLTSSQTEDSPCIANVCLQKKVTSFKEDGARRLEKELLWRPYIETGVLGEDPETNVGQAFSNSFYRRKKRVYLPERPAVEDPLDRLHLSQTVKTPFNVETPFTIEECANLDKLPLAKRTELANGGVKFCILAFGKALLVASKKLDTCNMRKQFMIAANLVGQHLDLDRDGKIDDAKVADKLDATRTTGKPAMIFIMGCSQAEETPENEPKFDREITGEPQSSQAYGEAGPKSSIRTLIEETFHYVHDGAWAWVYPDLVGYAGHPNADPEQFKGKKDSSLVKCHKQAMCEFWIHPEAMHCANSAGVACANPSDQLGKNAETVAIVAGYNPSSLKPGACTKGGCTDAACDLDEFFHKIYMGVIGESRSTLYRYVKASGGKKPNLSWSDNDAKQFDVWAAAVFSAMKQSTECAAFLNELKTEVGVGKTYKLPTSKFNYTFSMGRDGDGTGAGGSASGSGSSSGSGSDYDYDYTDSGSGSGSGGAYYDYVDGETFQDP